MLTDDIKQIELNGFDELIGTQMRYAYLSMRRRFSANLETLGLTQTQCATMWLLNANPAISQTELSKALDVDRVTMIGVIAKLQQKGLLNKVRSESDGRRFNLALSAEGEQLFGEVKTHLLGGDRMLAAQFTKGELMMLKERRCQSKLAERVGRC